MLDMGKERPKVEDTLQQPRLKGLGALHHAMGLRVVGPSISWSDEVGILFGEDSLSSVFIPLKMFRYDFQLFNSIKHGFDKPDHVLSGIVLTPNTAESLPMIQVPWFGSFSTRSSLYRTGWSPSEQHTISVPFCPIQG